MLANHLPWNRWNSSLWLLLSGIGWIPAALAQTPDAFNPSPNSVVYATAVQTDGKVLIGGIFTSLGTTARSYLARLNADGTMDTNFTSSISGNSPMVSALAIQPDNQILVGGNFSYLNGKPCGSIGRLNPDGTRDTNFVTITATGNVWALLLQRDGKILVGGDFPNVTGQTGAFLVRMNADGGLDTSFQPVVNNSVYTLALQPDDKILMGGLFTSVNGQTCSHLARLNTDGTLDTSFNATAADYVNCFALQSDNKILVGGNFTSLDGVSRYYLGRLNADGTLDPGFHPVAQATINSLLLQADGRILAGGRFTSLAGQVCTGLGRLNNDGTLDASFTNVFSYGAGTLLSLAQQSDGKLLPGGSFSHICNQTRNDLARLVNTDAATEQLTWDNATVIWRRGGTSPELLSASFDLSTNGINWVNLGTAQRIPGGWQLTGLSLPGNALVRARGVVQQGLHNASGWFVQSVRPILLTDGASFGFQGGSLVVSGLGSAGQQLVIEASADLLTWTALATNAPGSCTVSCQDSQSANLPARFYRVRSR